MLPKPLYEMLPFSYLIAGSLLISISDRPLLFFSGSLFFLAGASVWILRSAFRRITTPFPPMSVLLVIPEVIYESLPFAYLFIGMFLLKAASDLTVLIVAGILIGIGLIRLMQRSVHRHPHFFRTRHRSKDIFL